MKIVVLDGYTLNPGDLSWKKLEALGECTFYERTAPGEVVSRSKEAEVLLTNKTLLGAEEINALPRLKYIGVLATGYNVVDTGTAGKRGIVVTNIPAYSTPSVAQMVFAHILNITQQVAAHSEAVKEGKWCSAPDFCFWKTPLIELADLKLGIIGLGHIGQAVARIARSFGMEVLASTSKEAAQLPEQVRKVTLDELFAQSDVITLHCPLTDRTRGIINAGSLSRMKPSAILINTGRGPLVDEAALARALHNGTIYAAGLDVLSQEPPQRDNPLLSAPRCYITPHIAWATKAARERLMECAVNNLKSFLDGHVVNNVAG